MIYEALGGPAEAGLVTTAIVSDPGFAAVYAAVSLVAVAPGEELLFRGAIQDRLGNTFQPNVAIVGASVLFAAPRFFNIVGASVTGLFAVVTLFLVSLIWGTAFEWTDNLTVPILTHGLYNTGLAGVDTSGSWGVSEASTPFYSYQLAWVKQVAWATRA